MRIRINDIEEEGLRRTLSEPPDAFPVLAEIVASGDCGFTRSIDIDLHIFIASGIVEVEGRLDTGIRLRCNRCLEPFSHALSVSFALTYSPIPDAMPEASGGDVELTVEEMGLIPISGDEIDLRDGIQEQIVLALPIRPLCDGACKGLCPRCGQNLNRGGCGCEPEPGDPRFEALKNLRLPDGR